MDNGQTVWAKRLVNDPRLWAIRFPSHDSCIAYGYDTRKSNFVTFVCVTSMGDTRKFHIQRSKTQVEVMISIKVDKEEREEVMRGHLRSHNPIHTGEGSGPCGNA